MTGFREPSWQNKVLERLLDQNEKIIETLALIAETNAKIEKTMRKMREPEPLARINLDFPGVEPGKYVQVTPKKARSPFE